MNRLLKSSIILMTFAFALSIFQISCKEDVIAQAVNYILPVATSTTLGGVKPDGTTILVDSDGKISTSASSQLKKLVYSKQVYDGAVAHGEIWIGNFDGTGQAKVNITLPAGLRVADGPNVRLSPDGKLLFFTTTNAAGDVKHIYSCNADGSNPKQYTTGAGAEYISIGGAY